ncbi:MAG: PadR family transcriptional regulator [Acidobacteria bacterium]|nr:PadR family transcriptional regulator [Acidobacteriota bacterium]
MGSESTRGARRLGLMPGTLDMLILNVLRAGRLHGQGIVRAIELTSEEALRIDHGSLYPALQRLQQQGWVVAEWGISSNNRKARFYSLTRAGRRQLLAESSRWERLTRAIALVMEPRSQE